MRNDRRRRSAREQLTLPGLAPLPTDDPPPRPIFAALSAAIAASGKCVNALSRASGFAVSSLGGLVKDTITPRLNSIDKLAVALGIRLFLADGSRACAEDSARPLTEGLLAALSVSGKQASVLARGSGAGERSIRRFLRHEGTLELD